MSSELTLFFTGVISDNEPYSGKDNIMSKKVIVLEVNFNTVEKANDIARKNNVQIILNPAPAKPLPDDVLRSIISSRQTRLKPRCVHMFFDIDILRKQRR